MSYMHWDSSLSIGIDIIDEQHKQIVDYINKLDTAIKEHDNHAVKYVLDELVNYTRSHFYFEESLMEKGNYPHFAAHKQVHESFTNRINEYVEKFEHGAEVGRKLLPILRIWLTSHIKRDDKDYGPWATEALEKGDFGHQDWLNKSLSSFFE
ncbi:MAG: bacteriohemerythrin [Gammaproteobacteria bacterium]|nr:bacteriohemerythrin [Gammaproteobacteria bacterium]